MLTRFFRVWKGNDVLNRVIHSLQHQEDDGTNSNAIKSFFSRVEAYKGINNRISTKYLDWYMAMLSWKEDTRYTGCCGLQEKCWT
ncbi:transposase [Rhizobium ruizarguesonis]